MPRQVRNPQDVRRVVAGCRGATAADASWLRELALTSSDPLVAGNALSALGRLRAVADDRELCALIEDPRLRVRQEIIVALGQSGDLGKRPLLERAAQDGEESVCRLAQEYLRRLDAAR